MPHVLWGDYYDRKSFEHPSKCSTDSIMGDVVLGILWTEKRLGLGRNTVFTVVQIQIGEFSKKRSKKSENSKGKSSLTYYFLKWGLPKGSARTTITFFR